MTAVDIALCVGHSRLGDSGATSSDGTNEWDYNSKLAKVISRKLVALKHSTVVIDKYDGSGYSAAIRWLSADLRKRGAKVAVELHFNAAGSGATGHEWLCWHSSKGGYSMAQSLDQAFQSCVSEIKSRGVKTRTASDRGSLFLRLTPCPAVIGEPFFGSNPNDWAIGKDMEKIGHAYAVGIHGWLGNMSVDCSTH